MGYFSKVSQDSDTYKRRLTLPEIYEICCFQSSLVIKDYPEKLSLSTHGYDV